MPEENQQIQEAQPEVESAQPTEVAQTPDSPAPKESSRFWTFALLVLGIFFAIGVLYTVQNLMKRYTNQQASPKPAPIITEINEVEESTETKEELKMEDAKKEPEDITDELLQEIEEIEGSDVQGAFDDDLSDLE